MLIMIKKFAALISPTIYLRYHFEQRVGEVFYMKGLNMKKLLTLIIILGGIFALGKFILNNNIETNTERDNISINQDSSPKNNDESLNSNNEDSQSNDSLSETNYTNDKIESILVNAGETEYIVAVDETNKEITINENIYKSDKYIKVDYEEVLPIINDIKEPKSLSIPQYINLYSKVSKHIDTNMTYSELFSLASNLNIANLKSEYLKFKNND